MRVVVFAQIQRNHDKMVRRKILIPSMKKSELKADEDPDAQVR